MWKIQLDDMHEVNGFIMFKLNADREIKLKDNSKFLIDKIELKINS